MASLLPQALPSSSAASPRTRVVPFSVPFGLDWATASNPAASWAPVVVPCSHLRKETSVRVHLETQPT